MNIGLVLDTIQSNLQCILIEEINTFLANVPIWKIPKILKAMQKC